MKAIHREIGEGMKSGKFMEAALLGRPRQFESDLPLAEALKTNKLIPLLRQNLKVLMQQTRENQTDDPAYPRRPFLKKLLNDVEDRLATQFDMPGSYEVRVYSTVGTVLDAGGIDFWVEIYDEEKNEIIADFKIDLKSNPHGRMGRMADYLYYCDERIASDDNPKAIFSTGDYADLVAGTADHLSEGIKKEYIRGTRRDMERLQF